MKEIDPGQTGRAEAFALWMNAPMPMVTLFKTLDVTNLAGLSRRRGRKFNMLMCWCIGGISTCDIPFSRELGRFERDYLSLTAQVRSTGQPHDLEDCMVIGTSALSRYDIDGAVNIYAGVYNNPFLIWGRYRKRLLRTELPVSFQFHHTQLDGIPAARFLEHLQAEIRGLKL